MNHVFCFVSSAETEDYSRLALNSFFLKTKLEKGDIFVFLPNEISESNFLENTEILVIRTPSDPSDKYIF